MVLFPAESGNTICVSEKTTRCSVGQEASTNMHAHPCADALDPLYKLTPQTYVNTSKSNVKYMNQLIKQSATLRFVFMVFV
jgi:hypothetical protein